MQRDPFVRVAAPLAVAIVAVGVLSLAILAGGYNLPVAFSALWRGAFGTPYAVFSATLVRATPLIVLGLSVAVSFRAGLLNIGADGQFLAGASLATAIALLTPAWPAILLLPTVMVGGVVGGAAWASIAALLRRRFGVLEVISTLMLNFVAQQGVSFLLRGPLQEPTRVYPQTIAIPEAARLGLLIHGQRLHWGIVTAIMLAIVIAWILRSTAMGFRVRVVGAGPAAAASAGRVDVERMLFGVFLSSGAIAGFAGAVQVTGVTYQLSEGFSPGYGYSAIAVALLARLNPLWVILAGVLFGALEAGAGAMQREAGVPFQFVAVVEALVILGVLAVDRVGSLAAARQGTPDKPAASIGAHRE